MTETDATKRPLTMPEKFIPYLEKYRVYKVFKDMTEDLIVHLPKDHLKHMKVFLGRHLHSTGDIERIMMLVSPNLKIDIKSLTKELIRDMGFIVITRRCVMDRYERHDDYIPGCISPVLMSEVTKQLACKEPVAQAGWLMFDHPCTVREARCLQQDGIFPTVTLVLTPTPPQAPPADDPLTPSRNFFQQDFEGLKFAYKATLKEVYIDPDDDVMKMSTKCFNAIRACASGLQHTRHGYHVVGAPGVYRVVLVGPRGSGARTQGLQVAKHFGLIYMNFADLYKEALEKDDEVGDKLRKFGPSSQLRAEILRRRILKKDCVDLGWVLSGFPANGLDFENLDNMSTPPNRIIFLNADWQTCKKRLMSQAIDWCTGRPAVPGSGPRVLPHPTDTEAHIDYDVVRLLLHGGVGGASRGGRHHRGGN
ncbi:adenylate kinase 8-like isoform X2 [Ostrinia nubilalis]|uniref:adenylate kinase 8-like isoform X2 n=1 Tax=Ostrinia nubilalis TaxID=29057 RepID=UPI0030822129